MYAGHGYVSSGPPVFTITRSRDGRHGVSCRMTERLIDSNGDFDHV